jgi:hypothetical protein
MRWLNFKCLMLGHEDRIRRDPGRIYLECAECGRQTKGWNVTTGGTHRSVAPPAPPQSWIDPWRERWSQAWRRLEALGLR